jgi:hypothetical protein
VLARQSEDVASRLRSLEMVADIVGLDPAARATAGT